jgi:hypothetical protein
MKSEEAITKCLKSRHNLSELGLDRVGHRKVPSIWKCSRTALLYKKGVESEMKHWRPISVAGCVYQLFTAMISQWVRDESSFEKLQIFSRCQSGFFQGQVAWSMLCLLGK